MNVCKKENGFTLIEVLIVITIIGILFFILVPQIGSFYIKSNESGIRTDFKSFQTSTEAYFRETLGANISSDELNKFLDSAHKVSDNGSLKQTKSEDPWGNLYEVRFGSKKITYGSYGKEEDSSIIKYGLAVYYYNGVIDSCTYGFATGNIELSKIKGLPDTFICGDDLSVATPPSGVLTAPSNFKTTYVSQTTAILKWDSVTGATSYQLKRNGTTIYSGSNTSYSDITLSPGITYNYEIIAKNASETSPASTLSVTTTLTAPPMTGAGTISDPYMIYDVFQLQNMNKKKSAHYALGTDIDASVTAGWNSGAGFISVTGFTGSLDGKGYSINNLTMNNTGLDEGIFAQLDSGGSVKNVTIINANITAKSYVGIVVGEVSAGASITNVHVSGVVTGDYQIGGIVGINKGNLSNVSSNVVINGDVMTGGIAGYTFDSSVISNAVSEGTINGTDNVGGIVGWNDGQIIDSSSNANINGADNVGGIAGNTTNTSSISNVVYKGTVFGTDSIGGTTGWNNGVIKNATSEISITANRYLGGITGWNNGQIEFVFSNITIIGENNLGGVSGNNNDGVISYASSKGSIKGKDFIGGLSGTNNNIINNSFAETSVTGNMFIGGLVGSGSASEITNSFATGLVNGNTLLGGLMGTHYNSIITSSYYDKNTTGRSDTGKGVGKTTADMKLQSTYVGWDFTDTWGLNAFINNGYPYLRNMPEIP